MEMFGRADSTLPMLAMRPYDHYVLCSPDFEFVQDGTRRDSRLRERQHAWYLEESAREQRAGFPTIRAIPSYVSLLFLEFAAGCEEREIRSMSWSRQRRPWPGFARRVLDVLPRLLEGLEHRLPEAMEDGLQIPLQRRLIYVDTPRR